MPCGTLKYRPTVLVVDDDPNIISAFMDFLRREECTMISASSIHEAIEQSKGTHIDLLISDVRLGYQSGISLMKQMKAYDKNLPVILITGYPETVKEEEVKKLGADYLLPKPLDLMKLRESIRVCLHLPKT